MYYNWKKKVDIEELNIISDLIKNGDIVVFPTETVYGIGANAFDEKAVEKIFKAKGRPSDNPLIVHLSDKKDIQKIAKNITEIEQKLIDAFMPGPFTIILQRKSNIPDCVTAGLDTVAIRIPENEIAQKIISYTNLPIAAPSANISGKPSGTTIEDIRNELENNVSAIIDGGNTKIGLESTVVKVIEEIPVILRPGKITPDDIKNVIGIVKVDNKVFEKVEEKEKIESPGMKYRHYAPETKCKLIYYKDEKKQIEKINSLIEEYKKDVVVLGFSEHKNKIMLEEEKIIEIGNKSEFEQIAQKIYTALRKADEMKPKIILIEGIPKEGLGIAIMNRLLRTCEYDYIEG